MNPEILTDVPILRAKHHGSIIPDMQTMRYVYWQHDDMWLGYLEEFPDYWTQGGTVEELQENLKDLHEELTSGNIPEVRRVAELHVQ